ncbi:hypothetical protein D3C71_1313480 [compost metagenome]
MGYSIYSDFDLHLHKLNFMNYFEAILLPSGEVVYAVPSHTEKLIQIYGVPKDLLYNLIPVSDSPIRWLLERTNCLALWSKGYYGDVRTKEQKLMLEKLIHEGLVANRLIW